MKDELTKGLVKGLDPDADRVAEDQTASVTASAASAVLASREQAAKAPTTGKPWELNDFVKYQGDARASADHALKEWRQSVLDVVCFTLLGSVNDGLSN